MVRSKVKVITISGYAQAGKDLSAQLIKEKMALRGKKVLILHYGDYLKFIAKEYFGWDGKKDEKGRTLLQCLMRLQSVAYRSTLLTVKMMRAL